MSSAIAVRGCSVLLVMLCILYEVVSFAENPSSEHLVSDETHCLPEIEAPVESAQWPVVPKDVLSATLDEVVPFLQRALIYLDYLHIEPTFVIDDETTEALKAFQQDYSLEVTGCLDEPTLLLLCDIFAEKEFSIKYERSCD